MSVPVGIKDGRLSRYGLSPALHTCPAASPPQSADALPVRSTSNLYTSWATLCTASSGSRMMDAIIFLPHLTFWLTAGLVIGRE
ncbi:hypothetical protein CCMA1212_005287 [Trichoderma ghanense]|uniref:Uncharacterized protein n=1 Tax=Trichoderma ghanense TaxID=65468 RepID=A0ABY2H372_9HYPO